MSKVWQYLKQHAYGALTIVTVLLCILGSCIANLAQTDFGNVTKENLTIETSSGHRLGVNMLKPKTATNDKPAPTIVFAHGGNGLKEKWDLYQIEWARRGFVVFSFDLYGHGDSEILNNTEWLVNGRGLYDTVKYAATLPFVDKDQIAVSGQSRGGNTIHETILLDNKAKKQLIKAVLYVSRDAVYKDNETQSFGYVPGKTTSAQAASKNNGEYFNYYGNRNVGIIAGKFDQYSFKETDKTTGKMLPNPDYLKHNNAKSFLNFGITPDSSTADGVSGKYYTKKVDGKEAFRVIYLENGFHTSQLFQSSSTAAAMEFMVKAFNVNTSLQSGDQIYQWRMIGSTIGFIGMFMFAVFSVALPDAALQGNFSWQCHHACRGIASGNQGLGMGLPYRQHPVRHRQHVVPVLQRRRHPYRHVLQAGAGTVCRLHAGDFLRVHRHCHLHLVPLLR